jgi:hypothetical protein
MSISMDGIFEGDIDTINQANQGEGGIKLPFPAVYARWRNGSLRDKPANDFRYFGGWSIGAKFLQDFQQHPLAQTWKLYDDADDKESWQAFGHRVAHVALLANRKRWGDKQGNYSPFPVKGVFTSAHRQDLAMLFDGQSYSCPVVLTTKGWQATYLQDSLNLWKKVIDGYNTDHKSRFPLAAFVISLGSADKTPVLNTVGSGKDTKTINPIQAAFPPELTDDVLEKRYIGAKNFAIAAQLVAQAKDWLGEWKRKYSAPQVEDEPIEVPF